MNTCRSETPRTAIRRVAGFTLIEVLVVVIIIGIVASIVTLSVGVLGRDREMEDEARRFWAVLQQAREEGELQGIDLGAFVSATGYEFLRFDARQNLWTPVPYDKLYVPHKLPEGLRFRMRLESRQVVLAPGPVNREEQDADTKWPPQIVLLSNGDTMPFELELERDGAESLWRIVGLADNDLRVERRDGFEWRLMAQTKPPPADERERTADAR